MSTTSDIAAVTSAGPPTSSSRIRGTGEMADRIRSFAWQDSPLGPIETWPAELTVSVNMMLSTESMAAVYWGPEMILLYNDAYRPCLTNRHPALGKPFWVVWDEARPQVDVLMESPLRTGKTFITPPVPFDLYRNNVIEQMYYSMTGTPIFVLGSGESEVGGVYLTLTDQTENSVRAEQLAASEATSGRVLASIGDAVIVTDAEGRITAMNGVAEQLTMWTEAEAQGCPLDEVFRIVNEDTRVAVPSPIKKVQKTGQIGELAEHTLLVGKHGRETSIDDSAAPIFNDAGKLIGIVLVFRDVGERRVLERGRASFLDQEQSKLRLADALTDRLMQEQQHLKLAIGATKANAFNWDLAKDFVQWSGNFPLGRDAGELTNPAVVFSLLHAEDRPRI